MMKDTNEAIDLNFEPLSDDDSYSLVSTNESLSEGEFIGADKPIEQQFPKTFTNQALEVGSSAEEFNDAGSQHCRHVYSDQFAHDAKTSEARNASFFKVMGESAESVVTLNKVVAEMRAERDASAQSQRLTEQKLQHVTAVLEQQTRTQSRAKTEPRVAEVPSIDLEGLADAIADKMSIRMSSHLSDMLSGVGVMNNLDPPYSVIPRSCAFQDEFFTVKREYGSTNELQKDEKWTIRMTDFNCLATMLQQSIDRYRSFLYSPMEAFRIVQDVVHSIRSLKILDNPNIEIEGKLVVAKNKFICEKLKHSSPWKSRSEDSKQQLLHELLDDFYHTAIDVCNIPSPTKTNTKSSRFDTIARPQFRGGESPK